MFTRYAGFILLLVSLFLTACSSNQLVQTYPGEKRPDADVAVLTAPENITVLSVNGKAVTQYLLSNLEVRYALEEGKNLVVFQYESIWGKAKRDAETGSRVDVAQSRPLEVLIQAKAGEQYTFSFMPAENLKEAQALAADFATRIVDSKRNMVAESVEVGTHQLAEDLRVKEEQKRLLEKQATVAEVEVDSKLPMLDQLKALWSQATAEQKKAFMVWVFQD